MATQFAAARRWTYEEFAQLPDDGSRYEVIGGELYVTPTPRSLHQKVVIRLSQVLESFAVEHGLGEVFGPLDLVLGPDDFLQPDLLFVRKDRIGIVNDHKAEAAPDLVIEVLSPATALRDRGLKRERYAQFGVPEYWIVDADARKIEIYRLKENSRRPIEVATGSFTWQPVADGPTLRLDAAHLLRDFR
jgi:Uma2 family endonuclease